MKICPVCTNKMVIVLGNLPNVPNKDIEWKLHYKCKNCGCDVYKTNILEVAEEVIKNRMEKQ